MRILVTGRETSGAWPIRGLQLGEAIGAKVEPNASKVNGVDLAIVVKRPRADLLSRLRERGVPYVWDIVDSFPQPDALHWDEAQCKRWLAAEVERVKPAAIVAATQAMAADCACFGVPVLALPHHARPGQRLNPIRGQVQAIGYEGGLHYLGHWQKWLMVECSARKWRLILNPKQLADIDIVVAVRAQTGYAPRSWKSGIKSANAKATGTPCILNREAGYLEEACSGEGWADTQDEMAAELTRLADAGVRRHAAAKLREANIPLDVIAERYLAWLESLPLKCPVDS